MLNDFRGFQNVYSIVSSTICEVYKVFCIKYLLCSTLHIYLYTSKIVQETLYTSRSVKFLTLYVKYIHTEYTYFWFWISIVVLCQIFLKLRSIFWCKYIFIYFLVQIVAIFYGQSRLLFNYNTLSKLNISFCSYVLSIYFSSIVPYHELVYVFTFF